GLMHMTDRRHTHQHVLRGTWLIAICLAAHTSMTAGSRAQDIAILPPEIALHGPEARQTLLVERRAGDQFTGEARLVHWDTSDPDVVRVDSGIATPVGD